jgi:RNA polymerase subunit RPABC4/transcription elongation factor Spt4
MRYCNHCHRLTSGQPLFCNFCGRSYDLKLCPHRHPNPRTAEVCSQCGSRDLSVPHPQISFLFVAMIFILKTLSGLALILVTLAFLSGLLQALLSDQQLLFEFMLLGLLIGFLWWLYLKLPRFVRRQLWKLFGGRERNDHEH